ncbi:uncharacterized protein Bfra_002072 [Botrytis fragariae]|uniref:2EXR domain-containing protein n=1 Tax=Botrytis fragariae TaxID=1964551 RepID=A0A8H6B209_9HELO|nr:uncharacterized protein Bfra_002072 [Botrytis fragariae]KAF5877705.1 hypothetical protein Bfra_002072 [Botrytis fragariae]
MSTALSTTTPTSSFLTLPSELRLKIWSNLLPGPRTLPIRCSRIHKSYYTPVPTSVLLSISSETRTLFLEHYSLLHLNPSYNSTIYINFALDTLCFDHEECSPIGDLAMDFKTCAQKDLIERVDIDVHLWEIMRLFRFDALAEIKYLYGLKNLTFVLRKSDVELNNGEEDEANNTRARTRDVWGGRMLIEGQTMDREIAQCQWYVSMMKWEVEHGTHQWTDCKPNVQMCII